MLYPCTHRSFLLLVASRAAYTKGATLSITGHTAKVALNANGGAPIEMAAHNGTLNVSGIVTADDVSDPTLREMLTLFDALPDVAAPGGETRSLADPAQLAEIKAGWLRGGWKDEGLWDPNERASEAMRRHVVRAVRANYRRIVERAAPSDG